MESSEYDDLDLEIDPLDVNPDIQRTQNVLVLFSGGLDSAAVLVKLLKETQYKVHAHHIIIKNNLGMWKIEQQACKQIIYYCKKHYRPFQYTHNLYQQLSHVVNDMETTRFTASQLFHKSMKISRPYIYICSGRCLTDLRGNFKARSLVAKRIFYSQLTNYNRDIWPKFWFPLINMDKKDIVEFLPSDIYKMCWYCRYPQAKDSLQFKADNPVIYENNKISKNWERIKNISKTNEINKTNGANGKNGANETNKMNKVGRPTNRLINRDIEYAHNKWLPCGGCQSCKDIQFIGFKKFKPTLKARRELRSIDPNLELGRILYRKGIFKNMDNWSDITLTYRLGLKYDFSTRMLKYLKQSPAWVADYSGNKVDFSDVHSYSKILSYIPGFPHLTDKYLLSSHLKNKDYYPKTLLIRNNEIKNDPLLLNSASSINPTLPLFLKRASQDMAKGVYLVRSPSDALKLVDDDRWILQRSVDNLYLINKRKFDIRVHSLILWRYIDKNQNNENENVNENGNGNRNGNGNGNENSDKNHKPKIEMIHFLHDNGYIRMSGSEYIQNRTSESNREFGRRSNNKMKSDWDRSIYITNNKVQTDNPLYDKELCQMPCDEWEQWSEIYPKIKQIASDVNNTIKPKIYKKIKRVMEEGLSQKIGFMVLGWDFLIKYNSKDLEPVLIEINNNPGFNVGLKAKSVLQRIQRPVIKTVFQIAIEPLALNNFVTHPPENWEII